MLFYYNIIVKIYFKTKVSQMLILSLNSIDIFIFESNLAEQ